MHVLYYMELLREAEALRWLSAASDMLGESAECYCNRERVNCMERLDCLPSVHQMGRLKALSLMGRALQEQHTAWVLQ